MPFDVEAARKEGYSDDEILQHLTASRKFDVQGALKEGYSKQELIDHLSSTAAMQAPAGRYPLHIGNVAATVAGLGVGAARGAGSTLAHTADIVERMAGTPRTIENPVVQDLITPKNVAEQVGYGAEKMAEFLAPTGATGAAARAVEGATAGMRAAPLLNLAARTGLEAGSAAGVAGLQTGGDPEEMKKAAEIAALFTGGVGALGMASPRIAKWAQESAEKQYGQAINPTKEKTKFIAEKTIPGMIKQRIWGSLPNILEQAESRIRYYGQQIDDVWEGLKVSGGRADIAPLMKRLEDVAKENLMVQTPSGAWVVPEGVAQQGMNELGGIARSLHAASEWDPVLQQQVITTDTMRRLRQIWDEVADKGGAFTKRPGDLQTWVKAMINRHAGDSVRAELGQALPNLAEINKQFAFAKNMEEIVEQTMLRRTGQQTPLGRRFAQVTGAMMGHGGITSILGAVGMEQLQRLTSSTTWRTLSAVNKDRLADALTSGNRGAAEFYLRKLLSAAGATSTTAPASQNLPPPRRAATP